MIKYSSISYSYKSALPVFMLFVPKTCNVNGGKIEVSDKLPNCAEKLLASAMGSCQLEYFFQYSEIDFDFNFALFEGESSSFAKAMSSRSEIIFSPLCLADSS